MSDQISITLQATTMEGLGAEDPLVTVTVHEESPIPQPVATAKIPNFKSLATVNVPAPAGYPTWRVYVSFSKFDANSGFVFFPSTNRPQRFTMKVSRLPTQWKPQFTSLAGLPTPRFDPLKKVLSISKNVDLKNGPAVGDLGAKFDTLADPSQILAKMALLNLFAVTSDESDPEAYPSVPWFTYVRKVVRIDQERFIAEADPALYENVQTILRKLQSTYTAQGYFTESAALHTANIPPQYDIQNQLLLPMITVKKKYEQGNLQLTLAAVSTASGVVHLLDCDMDGHANIVEHGFDLVKHIFDGGTHPVDMHEYIVEDSAQQSGGISKIDLGYQLV
jgi:hypothetical protein